ALAIVITGYMACELGGRCLAQLAAALAVALSALPMFEGTEFQYSSFDYLWWVLTKYSIVFYIAGVLGGMLLTSARRYFRSPWFWAGTGLALLICLPNVIWQVRHDFISYHFLQHIQARDVSQGRADGFLVNQLWICTNPASVPMWIAGLIYFLRDRRYRMLGWMYVIPLALFLIGKGRDYYLAPAYPML